MSRLKEIIERVFDESYEEIKSLKNFNEFGDWDSLMYVSLIANIEKTYGIELTRDEIQSIINIGCVEKVLKGRSVNDM